MRPSNGRIRATPADAEAAGSPVVGSPREPVEGAPDDSAAGASLSIIQLQQQPQNQGPPLCRHGLQNLLKLVLTPMHRDFLYLSVWNASLQANGALAQALLTNLIRIF